MISQQTFYGGGELVVTGSDYRLNKTRRVVTLRFTGPGLAARLPDARTYLHTGGPAFHVVNVGTNAFDLEDADGGIVATIAADATSVVLLSNNQTRAGRWHAEGEVSVPPSSSGPPASPSNPTEGDSQSWEHPGGTVNDEPIGGVTLE